MTPPATKPPAATNYRAEVYLGRLITWDADRTCTFCTASTMEPGVDQGDPATLAAAMSASASHVIYFGYADLHGMRHTRHGEAWVDADGHFCLARAPEWWRFQNTPNGRVALEPQP